MEENQLETTILWKPLNTKIIKKSKPIQKNLLPKLSSDKNYETIYLAIKSSGRTFISRNSTCICSSGKRFKNCCLKLK